MQNIKYSLSNFPLVPVTLLPALIVCGATPALGQSDVTIDGGETRIVPFDYPSPWSVPGELTVGDLSDGDLYVELGSAGSADTVVLGRGELSDGYMSLINSGTLWTTQSDHVVGYEGEGTFIVSNGAKAITNNYARIGEFENSDGEAIITGSGTRWEVGASIVLGRNGQAEMVVGNDALTDVGGNILIADDDPGAPGVSESELIVDGADSLLNVGGYISIGHRGDGKGSVLIDNGGRVKTNQGLLGYLGADSEADLHVTGKGSEWIGSSYLWVGYNGSGTATLDNEGLIRLGNGTEGLFIANGSGTSGTFNIGAEAGEEPRKPGQLEAGTVTVGYNGGDAELVFNHTGSDHEFAPDIYGPGDIRHLDGTTRFTGDSSSFGGQLTVSNGTVIVDDKMGGTTSVAPNGFLKGSGSLKMLEVSGLLNPGNSVGTMSVSEDVTFKSGSTYRVEVDATGADRLTIGGTVKLDGDVDVVSLEPDEDRSVLGDYVILSAGDGIEGNFDSVRANYAFLDPSLSYGENDVTLSLSYGGSLRKLLEPYADTPDANNFVKTLDTLDENEPGFTAFQNALLTLQEGEQEEAAEELSGEAIPAADGNLIQVSNNFLSSIQGRISGGIGGGGSQLAQNRDPRQLQLASLNISSTDASPQATQRAQADARRIAEIGPITWARAVGSRSKLDANNSFPGVKQRSYGVHAGVEAPLGDGMGDGLMIGGALGFERGKLESDAQARSDFDSYSAGLYARQRIGNLRLSAGGSYSFMRLDSQRGVTGFGNQEADYDAGVLALDGEAAYDIPLDETITVSPLAGLRYSRTHREGYEEDGVAGLDVESSTENSLRSRLGAEMSVDLDPVTLSLRGAWSRELASPDASTEASLLGGEQFTIEGQTIPENLAEVGLGLDVQVDDSVEIFASYDGAFSSRYRSHSGQMGIRFLW